MPMPMSEVTVFSIAIFALVIIFLLASAMVGPGVIVAIRNLTRRWRQTLLAVAALAVGTAMITSSLVVGDSLRSRVEQNIDANLNDVGVVVHAPALVPMALFERLSATGGPLDGVPYAGIIMTACSVRSAATGEVVAGTGLNALDPGSGAIGSFKGGDGRSFAPLVQRDLAVVNERVA